MKLNWRWGVLVISLVSFVAVPAFPQAGHSSQQGNPQVSFLVHHGASRPLREIPPILTREGPRVIPLRPIPHNPRLIQSDTVVQSATTANLPTTSQDNFDGVGQGAYGYAVTVAPPDTNGAVGLTQYVQWVNLSFAVFDKSTGTLQYGPAAGNTLWQGSGLTACETTNDGDPVAQYDKAADRWVMTQLSFRGGPPYYLCIAVSATGDATGAYYRYALQWVGDTLPDYPKLAVWPDAYYTTFNMFFFQLFFLGAQTCALERDKMLNDQDATVQCFQLSSSYPSLLPADWDGATAPPAGSPNFLLNLGSNSLNLWRFHVDFANPNNTTLAGPINVPVASFNFACGNGGTCVPQFGTTQKLDTIGERLMFRLVYRNFGDHEALLATHSVSPKISGGRRNATYGPAAVRWYELRNPNGSPSVFQQGTFAPDSNYRWMGSIAMDKVGDIAVGYSVSSSNMSPSIRYSGRLVSDALGKLQTEVVIIDGTGSQLSNLSRWGDYSSMRIDPVDDCTFWYTTEYLKTNGTFNWNTRIASFKFPTCQ